jgi:hypothetical protein
LESLEERALLSTYTLYEIPTPGAPTVYETVDSGAPMKFVNHPSPFVVNTASGSNTVNILDTSAHIAINVNDGGHDTVNVGNAGGVQGILAPLNINGLFYSTLNVNDAADTTARTVTLATITGGDGLAWGTITGLAPAAINYAYDDISSVSLTTGSGGDTVNVLATGTNFDGMITNLSSHGGSDVVNVGNAGSLQSIRGPLNINNPPSYTTLNVNDAADTTARTVTLATITGGDGLPWGTITGLTFAAPINYEYRDISSVSLTTGSGDDTVNVQATGSNMHVGGVITNLSSSGGHDTVNVGNNGSVQGIRGDLYVENPPWYTTLNINDSADTTAREATLSSFVNPNDSENNRHLWGTITGLAPASINFEWEDLDLTSPVNISAGGTVVWSVNQSAWWSSVPAVREVVVNGWIINVPG